MPDADRFISQREQDEPTAHEETDREGAGAGTSSPSQKATSNATYTDERHNCTDRRTDLRTTDGHASWREVAARCHVPPGR